MEENNCVSGGFQKELKLKMIWKLNIKNWGENKHRNEVGICSHNVTAVQTLEAHLALRERVENFRAQSPWFQLLVHDHTFHSDTMFEKLF